MRLLEENGMRDITYVEPFAGGASIALALLFEEYANSIHINDLSRPVYAFWHAALNDTEALCARIDAAEVTMEEWYRQRAVYDQQDEADIAELGFATFFLNRTNRSGIITGGVIGGKDQAGKWPLGARFNKQDLVLRIQKIGRYRNRIRLHCQDALDFTNDVVASLAGDVLAFYDPPYIEMGQDLYLNTYTIADHRKFTARVASLPHPWIVTYDHDAAIYHGLFQGERAISYDLSYSAQDRRGEKEIMFLSQRLVFSEPANLHAHVEMSAYGSRHPIYGKVSPMKPNREYPEVEEEPKAGERFVDALKTVLTVPKESVPNPFNKSNQKKRNRKPKNR